MSLRYPFGEGKSLPHQKKKQKEKIMADLEARKSRIAPGLSGDRDYSNVEEVEVEIDPAITTLTDNNKKKQKIIAQKRRVAPTF